jgi:hypothetical protein
MDGLIHPYCAGRGNPSQDTRWPSDQLPAAADLDDPQQQTFFHVADNFEARTGPFPNIQCGGRDTHHSWGKLRLSGRRRKGAEPESEEGKFESFHLGCCLFHGSAGNG